MRALLFLVGGLLALAVIGTVAVKVGRSDGSTPSDLAAGSAAPARRLGAEAGLATSDVVDVDGARLAAIHAVAQTDEVAAAGFISRRDVIAKFTTASFGPQLASETSAQMSALLLVLGERDADTASLLVIEQPITATVSNAVGDRVEVNVWSVLVVAAPGAGPGRQVWRTVTVDMVPVDGRWLVDAWTSTAGPAPALAPEQTIADSAELMDILSWSPAVNMDAG